MEFWSWLWGNPTDPIANLRNIELLGFMYSLNPGPEARFNRWISEQRSNGWNVETRFVEGTSTFTRTLAIRVRDRASLRFTLLISLGTLGTQHVQNLLTGWSTNAPHVEGGASWGFHRAADDLYHAIGREWFDPQGQTFYFIGHSYGGAQLQALALWLWMYRNPVNQRVWSYGSPRVGNLEFQRRMGASTNVRWYNDDDPVRLIPPHSDEAPILTAVVLPSLRNGCNTQVQAGKGFCLHVGGAWDEIEEWPSRLATQELGLLGWLTSSNGFASNLHSLDQYEARFTQAAVRLPAEPVIRVSSWQGEEPYVGTNHELNSITRQAVREIETPVYPAPIEGQDTVIRPGIYKARKLRWVGWCVARNGEVILRTSGKREARKVARQYNRMARAQAALII